MEKEKTKKLYGHFSRLVVNSVQSSVRKVVLKNFAIFTGKHLCWSLLIKLTVLKSNFIRKVTPTQVFFCEYCKNFQNTFFEHLQTTASDVNYLRFLQKQLKAVNRLLFLQKVLSKIFDRILYTFLQQSKLCSKSPVKIHFTLHNNCECIKSQQ